MLNISRTRLLASAATLALTASLGATPGLAAQDTATMNVTASINQSCTVSSDGDLDFNGVAPGVEATADTTFTVNCSFAGDVSVEVGDGGNHNGSNRRMATTGGALLGYQLWQSTARTEQWSDPETKSVSSGDNPFDVHGVIPASFSDGSSVGSYSDEVTITVSF